ncbi:MAG: response regulator [Anaerolineae bacterium]|nr:response regulator [Anaerolineae bacterium]
MSQQLKVLVVEDSPEFRDFIVEYLLKPNNFSVEVAEDGLSGLSKALKTNPDLILLDYELPRLNGAGVLRRLRYRGKKTPVILMTSHGSEQLAVEVFQPGLKITWSNLLTRKKRCEPFGRLCR